MPLLPAGSWPLNLARTSLTLGVKSERDVFSPERVASNAAVPLYDYVGGSQLRLYLNFFEFI